MADQAAPYELFLSYHWRDHDAVERLARALEGRGLSVFLDRWVLTPGLPWPQALEQALERCRAVAVCVGPHGMGPWQMREHFLALARQVEETRAGHSFPVIPVLLPGADPPLGFLKLNTWVTLRAGVDDPQAFETIARAARGLPPKESVRARPTICPYRGLQAFREEDAPFFFGREAFTDRLVKELRLRPLVAVVGASGSGKSSVVRAGLVPQLRKAMGGNGPVWDILTMFPGSRPRRALASAIVPLVEPDLIRVVDQEEEIGKLARSFAEATISLQDMALRCLERQPGTDRLLVFVDQWEELYTACKDEEARRWFIDQLLAASTEAPVSVVLTLRGDFYGRALGHRGFVDRLQDAVVNLGPMTRKELRGSIEKPAGEIGLTFDPGLVERILDDVGDEPGNLPLLEFTLRELWEKRQGDRLHFAAYEAMKGIKGAIAERANRVFKNELTDDQRTAARRVLVQLVRPGEGVPDTRRRAVLPAEDENALAAVHKLANARLLVTGRDETRTDIQTVEIAHEALIREWDRLREWVDEDRELLRTRERIESAAALWEKEGQVEDRLLPPGRPLAEGQDLLTKRRSELSPSLVGYIESSLDAEKHRQEALLEEERRRQKEREEAQRQKLRRRNVLAVAAVVVTLVMTAAGLFALNRWRAADEANRIGDARRQEAVNATTLAEARKEEADRERNNAVSQSLSAQATLLVERGKGEDAMLRAGALAVESWRRVPNPDAYSVAMKLLEWLPVRRIEADPGSRSAPGVLFSPDGRFLVIHSSRVLRFIETSSGRELFRVEEKLNFVPDVQFSSDSRFVWVWGRLINVESGKQIFTVNAGKFKEHNTGGGTNELATLSPDSRWLALTSADSGGREDGITVVDMHTGKEVCRVEHQLEDPEAVLGLVFSPDGTCLVISEYRAGIVRLIEVPSGRERARLRKSQARGFVGNGQYLVVEAGGESDRRLLFVDPVTGHEESSIHVGKSGWPQFSGDGLRMAMTADEEVRLLEVPTGNKVASWQDGFHRVFFDSSGRWLVLVSPSGLVRVIDSASGMEKSRAELKCETSDYWKNPVALRADADLLVLACKEGDVRVFKASTGAEAVRFKLKGRVWSLSPDSRLIVTQDEDQDVLRFHETATDQEFGKTATSGPLRPVIPPVGMPRPSAAFSSDGRYLALPSPAGSIQLVDLSSAYSPLKLDSTRKRQVIFSRDRRLLAFADADHIVRVVDMETGREIGSLRSDEPTFPVHISSDGQLLLTKQKSTLKLNEIETGREIAHFMQPGMIAWYQISPDGDYLDIHYRGKEPGQLISSSSLQEIMRYPSADLGGVDFSSDSRLIAMTNQTQNMIQMYDTENGTERLRITSEPPADRLDWAGRDSELRYLSFSPDGQTLAVDAFGKMKLFDTASGAEKSKIQYQWPPNARTNLSPSFSPDGTLLVVNGIHLELHNIDTGKELMRINVPPAAGSGSTERLDQFNFAFSPDSRFFAAGAAEGYPVRLFEAKTGKELIHVDLGWGFKGVLFSPDGRTLAAASNNGAVQLMDVASLKVIGSSQHAKAVTHMEFSPDSRYLITASADGTAIMMDRESGRAVARFEHGAPIEQANFSHDGQSLLTVSDDRIKLWPADPQWPFEQLCTRSGRNLSPEEWRMLIGESESWRATCPDWHTPDAGPFAAVLSPSQAGPAR